MPDCTGKYYRQILAKEEYFWSHLDRSNPASCWPWSGRIHTLGYGIMKVACIPLAHGSDCNRIKTWNGSATRFLFLVEMPGEG